MGFVAASVIGVRGRQKWTAGDVPEVESVEVRDKVWRGEELTYCSIYPMRLSETVPVSAIASASVLSKEPQVSYDEFALR